MMLLRKKTMVGLMLCTLVLTASVPLLLGIEATPKTVFGGDMLALSQVNSTISLNASMVDDLKANPHIQAASAEITCFSVIQDQPVVIRGVDLENFMEIENGTMIEGNVTNREKFAVLGSKLADRLDLDVGDKFLLTGSSSTALFQMRVDALFESEFSDDELLISLPYARKMAGLSQNTVLFIRVKTDNQTALIEDLTNQDQPVAVTDSAGITTPVNTNISEEERMQQQLAIKYLDTARFKSSNGSYVSLFVQEGSNSIGIVVTTFIILDGALAFIGSAAIISRAIIERRTEIGVISAIGADKNKIRRMILQDVFLISITASIIGTLLGYGVVMWVEGSGVLIMFGETIHATINSTILLALFALSVLIHLFSGMLVVTILTKINPRRLMQEAEVIERDDTLPSLESTLEAGN